MRIGFFTETYLPQLNGVSISLAFEKEKLEKLGHKVFVFAPKTPGVADNYKDVIRLSSMKVINSEPAQKMVLPIPNSTFRKMLGVSLDVVHAHGGGFFSFLGYQLALAKGYPYVITYHTYLAKYTHYFFIKNKLLTSKVASNGSKMVCNLADVVVVPTEKMKLVLESYGVSKTIEVVPNPIDTSKFKPTEKGYLRTEYKIPKDKLILLTASRLGKEKNVDFLIKAFNLVSKKNKNSLLVIAGDGPEKKALEALVQKLKLGDKVIFTGFIDSEKMPQVYSDCDIFLFASTSETQGMVVPEAAACGLPLVVVADPAFAGAIENHVNGYETLAREQAFARKLEILISNKARREEFGRNSMRLIQENFDQDQIIEKLVGVYQKAVEIRRADPRVSNRLQNSFKNVVSLFRYVRELNKKLGI